MCTRANDKNHFHCEIVSNEKLIISLRFGLRIRVRRTHMSGNQSVAKLNIMRLINKKLEANMENCGVVMWLAL